MCMWCVSFCPRVPVALSLPLSLSLLCSVCLLEFIPVQSLHQHRLHRLRRLLITAPPSCLISLLFGRSTRCTTETDTRPPAVRLDRDQ
uniref:Putative secreted peptide n=1 Tax=Anopheles braziliensis TaxID=58242 RepID=A0A2M3ZRB8_9DIPT